ncbi:MAG: histidine kinase dimerization/phospho-acceptor domain-containing protein [Myxococcota bacterium]
MVGAPRTAWGMVSASVVLAVCITLAHYTTDVHDVVFHNVFRRLYYVPVVLAAFGAGVRGGVGSAVVVSLAYIPHAFLLAHHQDPAPAVDKVLEIGLYLVVGSLTGWLVERERRARLRLERTLSERAELERELVRSGKLSALGELLAGVAHEIRNPLASIMGAAQALERHVLDGERGRRYVDLQLREIARLQRVVSNFLAFARARAPDRQVFSLERLIEDIVSLTRHQGEEGSFAIDPSVLGVDLDADRDQVSQILLNLTLNAIQCRGDRPFEIMFLYRERSVAERAHDGIGVGDRGVGVPAELEEKIFEPFFTTRSSGSGLGLSLSSRMAEAHGGFMELERGDGETIFWLYLPREVDDA